MEGPREGKIEWWRKRERRRWGGEKDRERRSVLFRQLAAGNQAGKHKERSRTWRKPGMEEGGWMVQG